MAGLERLSHFPRGIPLCSPTDKIWISGDFEWGYLMGPRKDLGDLGEMYISGSNFTYKHRNSTYVLRHEGIIKLNKNEMMQYRQEYDVYMLSINRSVTPDSAPLPKVRLLVPEHQFILSSPMYRGSRDLPEEREDFAESWKVFGNPKEEVGFAIPPDPILMSKVEFRFSYQISDQRS